MWLRPIAFWVATKYSVTVSPPNALPTKAPPSKDPIRWITRGVFLFVLIVFVWYLFADRLTPYTDQGRVRPSSRPSSPRSRGT